MNLQVDTVKANRWPFPAVVTLPVERHGVNGIVATDDQLADEVAVGLIFNDEPHAVMMVSPHDLEEFAYGFAFTEGIISDPKQILSIQIEPHPEGVLLRCTLAAAQAAALSVRQRGLVGRTGCGLCGVRHLTDALREPPPVSTQLQVNPAAIQRAQRHLHQQQQLNTQTGALHAAAWADLSGTIRVVREDVGRHNALDKLIGHLLTHDLDVTQGFCVITSRASYEMVTKAASAGIAVLAAISAPTALAVRVARECQLTLVGFVREHGLNVYSHAQRLHSTHR